MSARAIASAWAILCLNVWAISSAYNKKVKDYVSKFSFKNSNANRNGLN